jgi:hypothetical protein
MKTLGFILIVVGIVMIVVRGLNIPVEKKVVDVGPLEVSKTENHWLAWPTYAGAVIAVIGVVLVIADRRRGTADR